MSYDDSCNSLPFLIPTRLPHRGKGRAILPGQKIHASVAFKDRDYKPKATFIGNDKMSNPDWKDLVGEGPSGSLVSTQRNSWAGYLEMDLFDHESISNAIEKLSDPKRKAKSDVLHVLKRLDFMAISGAF